MTGNDTAAAPAAGVQIDTSKPHPARVYDWFLGGKDNYPVDEEMAHQLLTVDARGRDIARVNRAFMHRAIRRLGEAGVRQYLDIGTGIPTEPNLHQVAQRVAPESRIVYCDNDPIVLAHAEALLRSVPEGVTAYIQADARDPQAILDRAGEVLDFTRPVALSLLALLHFVDDEEGAHELVSRLVERLAPGSHLLLSHITSDFDPENAARARAVYRSRGLTLRPRSREEFTRFFDGLELAEPGVAPAADWHPEPGDPAPAAGEGPIPVYAGVARKP
ncbi:SAM-dependent methyltransferase [Streptomyces somaliensis DSM 40738]|uniref:SAM-dependent methyltransferase n=1 Tax=Streptomyces somaliensis (strain ATCC 33201 / DSM 40738 / JCM 12659 / KCTC 9044 / NCTC 11332 / NRRL B-12077 / IP 733) TaxID=1134445 RepID=A0AA44IF60_STRE0|nr:SAM-dependent methyltransferase [Streptomyces somaliensis]MCQ0025365.1 SAM-dependent methyltransferase [Streptomyces somaliensis DSM 40738]NKY16297.1 SAM-dependent methyltransferase [Streptomyces somaliensis DSM 40738]